MKPRPFPPNLENWAAEHVDDGVAESGADLVVQILLGLVAELADLVELRVGGDDQPPAERRATDLEAPPSCRW